MTDSVRPLRHEVVLASAGTGKTWRLTGRFLSLLQSEVPPRQILATTFTRLAAGQILEKVLGRLAKATVAEPRQLPILGRALRSIAEFQVLTLDAFFLRLLWALGPRSGLPAALTMAEDWDDACLRADAVERALEDLDREELLGLLRSLVRTGLTRSVHETLLAVIDSGWAAWRDSEHSAWTWLVAPEPPAADLVAAAVAELAALPLPRTRADGIDSRWQAACARVVDHGRAGAWEAILEDTLVTAAAAGHDRFAGRDLSPAFRAPLCVLADAARRHVLRALASENAARWQLLERFARSYRALQQERGTFRFDDLPGLLRAAVANDQGGADAGVVRATGALDHVLLDEFQDTAVSQWRVLRPLVAQVLAPGAPAAVPRSLFAVGDLKQWIYGWRDSEPALLERLSQRPEVACESLALSYRSSSVVLDSVNAVFGPIAENPALAAKPELVDAARVWQATFAPHEAALPLPGAAVLRASPAASPGESPEGSALRCAAERVAALHRAAPWATVGVLVRRGKVIPRLLWELLQLGVRASGEAGNPLDDSRAVQVVLSALHLADHPGDSAAFFHVATSPLAAALGIAVDAAEPEVRRDCARALRVQLVRDGYGAFLQRLWPAVAAAPQFDAWDRSRFIQLLELVACLEVRGIPRPVDLVRRVRMQKVESPRPGPVRVMTVHAAKGLEFDAVVLVDLSLPILRGPDLLWTSRPDPEGPITRVQGAVRGPLRALLPELVALGRAHAARTLRDALCILYVAMTRAIYHLEMVVPPPGTRKELSMATLLRGALAAAGGAEAGVLWQATSPQDWRRSRDADQALPAAPRPPLVLVPARRAEGVAPSHLAGAPASAPAFDLLDATRDAARARGIVLHRLLQEVEWLETFTRSDREILARMASVAPPPVLDAAVAALRALLAWPPARAVLARDAFPIPTGGRLTVWRERRFLVHAADGRVLRGSFDRVVVVADRARPVAATVVEWKTDAVDGPASVDALVAHYQLQLAAYRTSVARLTGLPESAVATCIVFTAGPLLVPVHLA